MIDFFIKVEFYPKFHQLYVNFKGFCKNKKEPTSAGPFQN